MKAYPMRARIRDEGGTTRVDVYDDIGAGFWSDGVTPASFAAQMSGVKGPLDVHISSSGGDVFDGLAIAEAIRSYGGPVTTVVDGIAASIASVIAQAGQKRVMAPGAMLMIHDAFAYPDTPNEAGLLKMAATVGKVSDNLAQQYATRAGGTVEQWRQAMQAETWYTADEAVAAGLADEVSGKAAQLPASVDVELLAARAPGRVMAALRSMPKAADAAPDGGDGPPCKTCGGNGRLPHPGTGKNGMKCPGCGGSGTYDPDSGDGTGAGDDPTGDEPPGAAGVTEPDVADRLRNAAGKPYEPQPYKRTSDENTECPQCQKFSDDDARYCGQCGTQLTGRTDVKEAALAPASNSAAPATFAEIREAIRAGVREELAQLQAAAKVDESPWDGGKAMAAGADADDPAAFYAGICAGKKDGNPRSQSSWALPYKYAPGEPPNAAGVKNALARLPQTEGLTNEAEAKKTLQAAMKVVNPDWEPDDSAGTSISAADALEQYRAALKGATA